MDTNVLISAMLSAGGSNRAILRLCLQGRCRSLVGEKLFHEYCDVIHRPILGRSPLSEPEREELLDALLSVSDWVPVTFLWRPNLADEGDNHVVELAVAGGADSIVTNDVRDLRSGELKFDRLKIETPAAFLKRWRTTYGNDDNPNA